MDDISRDGRDQGCGPEGRAQTFEVHDKENEESVECLRQEVGVRRQVPRDE